jgi:hypothetical protein
MEYIGEFENKFADAYMRNHKAVTVKNLRCFPRCSPEHKDNGYCGNEVIIRWRTQARQAGGEYETYSEFQEADAMPRYSVNEVVPESELYGVATLMRGEVAEADLNNGSIHFSRESKGWHYGWMAGRGNGSHALHEMRVFLFERLDRDNFVCRLVLKSSPFQVTSRKRIRPKKNSSASSMSSGMHDHDPRHKKRGRKENEEGVETPIKSSVATKALHKPATPSAAADLASMMGVTQQQIDSFLPPSIPPPNHLMDMNELIPSMDSPSMHIPSSVGAHHQQQQPPQRQAPTMMQPPPPHHSQQQQPHFTQPPMPPSKMDKPPAVPAFSRPRQPPSFYAGSSTNAGSDTTATVPQSSSHHHLPPPPTTHRHHQQQRQQQQQQQPPASAPQLPSFFTQANPQSSQFTAPVSQPGKDQAAPNSSAIPATTAATTAAANPAARGGVSGLNWPFFASTPPVYQHPGGTPPVYQHSISTTPPMFNFSHLFGGGGGGVTSDQTTNNLFASMYQGQGAPIDDVLDLLMQPTPPNTFAALQMYRQAHQQQAYMQREKEEKEKQARGTVGTT